MKLFTVLLICALLACSVQGAVQSGPSKLLSGLKSKLEGAVKNGVPALPNLNELLKKVSGNAQNAVNDALAKNGLGNPANLLSGLKSKLEGAVKNGVPALPNLNELLKKVSGNAQNAVNDALANVLALLNQLSSQLQIPKDVVSSADVDAAVAAVQPIAAAPIENVVEAVEQ